MTNHSSPDAASGSSAAEIDWSARAAEDARHDVITTVFEGISPNKMACHTMIRPMPDGSWVMFMFGGGDMEPMPENRVIHSRSTDAGKTWTQVEPVKLEIPPGAGQTTLNAEVMMHRGRATMFVITHDGTFANWRQWMTHSDDSCHTWSSLEPAPGNAHFYTLIWGHIVTRDGQLMLPFQRYLFTDTSSTRIPDGRNVTTPRNPRNGVLISADDGKTWTTHGSIRISPNDGYHGWAENNIVELADGTIAMIIRNDHTGVMYSAVSTDGGLTWPAMATPTDIPNPGTRATMYSLGGDVVALLNDPNPTPPGTPPHMPNRKPLSLWISFEGMKTWPYQRVLVAHSAYGPGGGLSYPDSFVSEDRKYLHFAFDDNRRRAVYVGARLPTLP